MDHRTAARIISAAGTVMNQFISSLLEDNSEEELMDELVATEQDHILPVHIEDYIGNVVDLCSKKQFQQNFPMRIEVFESLLQKIHGNLQPANNNNRQQVDPKKQLLAVLWLLATPDSYRSVAERFDLSKSTLFLCFARVVRALNLIAHDIIRWPTETEQVIIKAEFASFVGLSGVIGAVDGTYVNIKAPKDNAQRYVNRKGAHGITLQAVAVSSLKFTDCFAGYPSSVGDRRIFENSELYANITSNKESYFNHGEYIIGDKAYPRLVWCIPPYKDRGNLQDIHTNFNTIHAKTRQVIERAFALFFGRFRRLKYLDMNRVDLIPHTIIACCVLHNICLSKTELNIEQYIDEGMVQLQSQEHE